MIQILIKTLSL